ncbi:MAG TPA: WYL domain-containing protein [Chthonomonadaceae bacterium]|nr:WYL domain-containing protein [Chthonomonadaceae bacterium]
MATYYNSDAAARAARLFQIVTLVASRRPGERIGREQLAEACECTIKTIQRDIRCLQEAQVPLEYDVLARTYTLPVRGWAYPVVKMTATDAMALAIARGLLVNTPSALPFASEIATALEKVTAGLTPALRALLEAASRALTEHGGTARDYSHAPVGRLLEAIALRQTVEMLYESRSSHTTERRAVDPYRLDRRDGRYFELQAWCHRRQQVRTFALDRISDVRLTGQVFTPHPWDESDEGVVSGLRGGALIPVEVRFDARVAAYARERRWGFTPTFENQEDGSVILRGVARGTDGILQELLAWKRFAQVLGGPELRAAMQQEIRAMVALYEET